MTDPAAQGPEQAPGAGSALKRFAPIVIILIAAAVVIASGAYKHLSFAALRENYEGISAFVAENLLLAIILFVVAYIVVTALSLPGATLMSVLGGFLFGIWVGTLIIVISATAGAAILFFAVKTALGDSLRKRVGPSLRKMEDGFRENAFSYLMLLRLAPLFPFFVVNIAPAIFGVSLRTFIIATFIGIIPGAFAFASVGNGLGAVLAAGEDLQLSGLLLKPEVLTPIIALSILALIPIVYKAIRKTPASDEEGSQ